MARTYRPIAERRKRGKGDLTLWWAKRAPPAGELRDELGGAGHLDAPLLVPEHGGRTQGPGGPGGVGVGGVLAFHGFL